MKAPALGAFAHATIGVTSLDQAEVLWRDWLGFEIAARREGPDMDLAALWGLGELDITRQALVRAPAATTGALHLVEFARPGQPVRQDAQVFDHLPKNLDVYVHEIRRCFAELKARGARFRSDPTLLTGPGDMAFMEAHLAGHDAINIVLLELVGKKHGIRFNPRGFAGIGPLVTIIPNLAREEAFYSGVLGMATTLDLRLEGPVIEKMIGLPPGVALLLKVFGDSEDPLGRIEVIEYQHTRGRNLFARTRAPALGALHVTYQVADLAPIRERLAGAGIAVSEYGPRKLLYGAGPVISFHSPSGFRLEVQESDQRDTGAMEAVPG